MTAGRIFREVAIADGATLRLGERFEQQKRATLAATCEWHLRRNQFGGATSIVIETTSHGLVRAMRFTYAADAPFEEMIEGYRNMLGLAHAEEVDRVVWRDGRTTFSLWRERQGDELRLCSRLEDEALGRTN